MTIIKKVQRWMEKFKNDIAPIIPNTNDALTHTEEQQLAIYREEMGFGKREDK